MLIPESNPSSPPERQADPTVAKVSEAKVSQERPPEGMGEMNDDGPHDVPRPIGPERLRQLRKAIEDGDYPLDDDVRGGLENLFFRP